MGWLPLPDHREQVRLLLYLRDHGPTTQVVLGEVIGASRTRLSQNLERLIELGLLEPDGRATSRGGRPSRRLALPARLRFVGIDVGATSIDVAVTDGELNVLGQVSDDTPVAAGPTVVLGRIGELVRELSDRGLVPDGPYGIGIGLPGPVKFSEGTPIAPPIMPGWDGFDVRDTLSGAFGAPVVVDNDVNVMALGEHHAGVARSIDSYMFVKIGTGIGAAVMIDRRLYRGVTGSAGDIGHISLDRAGPLCPCSRTGCLEMYFGGSALAREAMHAAKSGQSPILAELLLERGTLSAVEVGQAASRGDPVAMAMIRDGGQRLGSVLAGLINFMNPGMVVVGGGVASLGHALLAELRAVVYRMSTPLATLNLPIVGSELGAQAGVIGAALLASDVALGNRPLTIQETSEPLLDGASPTNSDLIERGA